MTRGTTARFGKHCGLFLSAALAACGGGSQPAESPANSSATAEPAAGDTQATTDTPAPATSSGDASPASSGEPTAPAKPAQPSLLDLCLQGCAKVKAKCTESAGETCRMNCVQYEHPPEGCDAEARDALECARDAEDIPCVNIAPEICTYKFRRVVGCANGKPLEAKDDTLKVPAGWQRYANKAAGFSVNLPKGVTEGQESGAPYFSVKENGVTYSVKILPAPPEKPTQKNLVKVAMNLLGKCQGGLKLYGMVERPEKIFIRYDSKCHDGTELRGAYVIARGKMYVPTASAPKGVKAEAEALVYSFEVE